MTNFHTVQPSPPTHRLRGFTLIELMVTVAIIAILAAVAMPSYQQYVIRGHRTAAQAQMMDIANRQQQYLLANRTYATKSALEAGGYILPSEVATRYGYDITGLAAANALPTYSIVFTPIGGQAGDGVLVLTSEGDKSPTGKW
jgi:type IV pilus assembly protein PilE